MSTRLNYSELGIFVNVLDASSVEADQVGFVSTSGEEVLVQSELSSQPEGISSCGVALGLKEKKVLDFTVMDLGGRRAAAAVFTKNRCPSVTITRGREVVADGRLSLIVVNSGNANVFTPTAEKDLRRMTELLSKEFKVLDDDILVNSTGVIGKPLPMEVFEKGIPGLSRKLLEKNLMSSAEAILTTDVGPKVASLQIGDVVICGMAKGAGMIEPNMATMLAYLFTNVQLEPGELGEALEDAASTSFNSISVDSDTSTSDAVVLASSETVPCGEKEDFKKALRAVCVKLARDIVSRGEGATKIIEAVVSVDSSCEEAKLLGKAIINSPLVKCASHGSDPNWGRVVMALGKTKMFDNSLISPETLQIEFQGQLVFDRGQTVDVDLSALKQQMISNAHHFIRVIIGEGKHTARVWGCDLSHEYVDINGMYTT